MTAKLSTTASVAMGLLLITDLDKDLTGTLCIWISFWQTFSSHLLSRSCGLSIAIIYYATNSRPSDLPNAKSHTRKKVLLARVLEYSLRSRYWAVIFIVWYIIISRMTDHFLKTQSFIMTFRSHQVLIFSVFSKHCREKKDKFK